MGWIRFLRRGLWDHERARKIQSHLKLETDENLAQASHLKRRGALQARYFPARRAPRIDPIQALRRERHSVTYFGDSHHNSAV